MHFYNQGYHVSIFGSARFKEDNFYYQEAYKVAKILAQNEITIVTGGSDGIMEAANKGAYEVNPELSLGINIILPHEQALNPFVGKSLTFDNFSERKNALIKNSQAFIIFPGGFGSLDELFEIIVLKQTKFRDIEIYLFGKEFFSPLLAYFENTLVKEKVIHPEDLNILKLFDNVEELAKNLLKRKEEK